MRRFLYDTSIFIYALGRDHHYKEPCREVVRRAALGELQGEASVDLLQELAHQRARRTGDRPGAAEAARNVAGLAWWHSVEPGDVHRSLDIFEAHTELDTRDAIFAAVALNRGIDAILATDRAFDEIGALERIDPADERAVSALVA